MISVYLVDDHPFVREGLKTYLSLQEGIEVVGEANNGEKAVEEIKKLDVDVTIVDLHLPGIDGVEVTRQVKSAGLSTQLIVLSSFSDDQEVIAAIDAGAISYLMKDSPPQKLLEAIIAARKGEPVLHPRIARKLMKRVSRKEEYIEPLTSREKEVLAELANGHSNKEIGERLYISDKTVKTHVSNILRKLDVKDRTQAAIKAIENRIIDR
ncbi:MAG: response regulator [Halanaerobiales bacterium]